MHRHWGTWLTCGLLTLALAACGGGGGGAALPAPGGPTGTSDTVAPVFLSISGVEEGAVVSGSVTIAATAQDNIAVATLALSINGTQTLSSASGSLTQAWDTSATHDGPCAVLLTARDAAGNQTQVTVHVTVDNAVLTGGDPGSGSETSSDPAPPQQVPDGPPLDPTDVKAPSGLIVLNIAEGQTVWDKVKFNVLAPDDKSTWWVEVWHDGQLVAGGPSAGSYNVVWDCDDAPDGLATLNIKAYDKGRNSTETTLHLVVANGPDRTPPEFVTFPNTFNAEGFYPVTFDVDDDHEIASVAVEIEGQEVYRCTDQRHIVFPWNSLTYPDGGYLLTATVTDTAGKVARASVFGEVRNARHLYTVSGRLTAPNGIDPLPGVRLRIPVRLPSSVPFYQRSQRFYGGYLRLGYGEDKGDIVTDAEGRFAIHDVPPGARRLFIQPTDYGTQAPFADLPLQLSADYTLPASDAALLGGLAPRIAVVTGDEEGMQHLLARMGLGQVDATGQLILGTEKFVLVDGNESLADAAYTNLPDFMASGSKLDNIDVLYFCSGSHYDQRLVDSPAWVTRLQRWAAAKPGRQLHCGGTAYDYIEQAFPQVLNFGQGVEDGPAEPLNAAEGHVAAGTTQLCLTYNNGYTGSIPKEITWLHGRGIDLTNGQQTVWAAPGGWFGFGYNPQWHQPREGAIVTDANHELHYYELSYSNYAGASRTKVEFNGLLAPPLPAAQWSLAERQLELDWMSDLININVW